MLSAVIPSVHSYPAVPLARQQVHQRYVHPGPLVLGTAPLNTPTPTADRDRTVSRRSFYPWSDGPSTQDHRITMTVFRLCSTRQSHSQAGLCHCTRQLISDQLEPTIVRLRYCLGGDRPSQTACHTMSPPRMTGRCTSLLNDK